MTYLNFLMPYRYLGMPITYEVYNKNGDILGGHAYCIIRNGTNAFRILEIFLINMRMEVCGKATIHLVLQEF